MKTCTKDNCDRAHRARGLCASHYNQEHAPNRHTKKLTACVRCGKEVARAGGGGRRNGSVCSNECRTALYIEATGGYSGKALIGPVQARRVKPYPTWDRQLPTANRAFVNGQCVWCGDCFTAEVWGRSTPPLCCSAVCAKRRQWANKGQTSNWIVPRRRYEIYERDNWTCQLCGDPVDKTLHYSHDWAASLDHIVPRSRQLVPDHSSTNLRLAHRWCNAVLGDGTYYTEHDLAA